jgi:hypothetical protein
MSILDHIKLLLGITNNASSSNTLSILSIAPLSKPTSEFIKLLHDNRLLLVFDQRCERILHNGQQCENVLELRESSVYSNDGFDLGCKIHGGHHSIRSGSWFAGRRLPLSQLLYIFHLLRCGASTKTITEFFKEAKLYRENADCCECCWLSNESSFLLHLIH